MNTSSFQSVVVVNPDCNSYIPFHFVPDEMQSAVNVCLFVDPGVRAG